LAQKVFAGMSIPPPLVRRISRETGAASADQRRQDDARHGSGFWLWEVKDMAEAVAWVKRCPNPMPGPSEIEIRPIYEMADFGAAVTPDVAERHDRMRDKAAGR
jgi:hypothetical protein